MAGEISIPITLTAALVGELAQAGLNLAIQVDCSHAIHVRTLRPDRPGQPIITKPIELDCALSMINPRDYDKMVGRLQAAKASSNLFKFYSSLNSMGRSGTPTHGLNFLKQRNLKVEFPNFDSTIINMNAVAGGIADAIQACNAPNVAAFNALPDHVRRAMGMYLRASATSFRMSKAPEPHPRTAVA